MLINKNKNALDSLKEQLGSSIDIVVQDLNSKSNQVQLLYIKTLCDEKKIEEILIKPFYETTALEYQTYVSSIPNQNENNSEKNALKELMRGAVVVFFHTQYFLINAPKILNASITEATVETVIQGPQNALSESIEANINIIRHRYPQTSLNIEEMNIGKLSETRVMMIYDKNLANEKVLENLKSSLEEVEIDVLQASGQLATKLSKKRKHTLFPTLMITERPDRVALNLGQGKVVMLIDGTPFALIIPAVFYDFMSSMEDIYQPFWVSRFIVLLRYFGLFISLLMPSLYVGVTAYNTELFRVQLALSIAGSREGVPYPAYLEVFIMLLMMELLTEASVRLPKSIGSTATTVGGLILGQAAVEAGLVSNVMIIIVAAVAISNFVIPINTMSFAMRVVKYVLLAMTTFFGMLGLVMGMIGLIVYLTNLDSFGQPYLKLFIVSNDQNSKKEARPS
jgi:hypothetical protein